MDFSANKLEAFLLLVVGLMLAAIIYAYVRSDMELYRRYDVPLESIEIPTRPDAAIEGDEKALTFYNCQTTIHKRKEAVRLDGEKIIYIATGVLVRR